MKEGVVITMKKFFENYGIKCTFERKSLTQFDESHWHLYMSLNHEAVYRRLGQEDSIDLTAHIMSFSMEKLPGLKFDKEWVYFSNQVLQQIRIMDSQRWYWRDNEGKE